MTPLAMACPHASSVAPKVGKSSGLSSLRAYSSQRTARRTRRAVFRTAPIPEMRSQVVSGFSTTMGAATCSAIDDLLDLLREQHFVDALREPLLVLPAALHLAPHLPGMRGEEQDPVSDPHRFRDGVGDEEDREARVLPEAEELLLHLAAGESVERGERLVHEQDVRFDRHGARDRDPLLHAARKLVRERVRELGEADLLDGGEGLLLRGAAFELPARVEWEDDVLLHRLPREELIEFLEDHHPIGAGFLDHAAVEADLALDRRVIAAHRLEQRGLAAARWSEHHEAVGAGHLETDPVGGGDEVLARLVLQGYAAHLEERGRPLSCRLGHGGSGSRVRPTSRASP